jgi:hypothetical protein
VIALSVSAQPATKQEGYDPYSWPYNPGRDARRDVAHSTDISEPHWRKQPFRDVVADKETNESRGYHEYYDVATTGRGEARDQCQDDGHYPIEILQEQSSRSSRPRLIHPLRMLVQEIVFDIWIGLPSPEPIFPLRVGVGSDLE